MISYLIYFWVGLCIGFGIFPLIFIPKFVIVVFYASIWGITFITCVVLYFCQKKKIKEKETSILENESSDE